MSDDRDRVTAILTLRWFGGVSVTGRMSGKRRQRHEGDCSFHLTGACDCKWGPVAWQRMSDNPTSELGGTMKRHGVPATLTSTGRVSIAFAPGPDEALTGYARWVTIYRRFRKAHSRAMALRLTVAARRHGVVLS